MSECPDSIPSEINELFLCDLKPPVGHEICTLINTVELLDIIYECSSYRRIIRVVTWCKRFLHNSKHLLHLTHGTLSSSELSNLLCIVRNVQMTSFVSEIQCL
ncbi:integrase_H2C2 domain-containing protein [Nephila pilipes]|uniref:Integrase_H2C2 domain-containing protein n=1 Tax=Nephila pilipes TaxID=299642 RepID=A0A8X6QUV4_NEPPI|nr:integrase_H2C2 domain-containing protein [Nephila pilipes]